MYHGADASALAAWRVRRAQPPQAARWQALRADFRAVHSAIHTGEAVAYQVVYPSLEDKQADDETKRTELQWVRLEELQEARALLTAHAWEQPEQKLYFRRSSGAAGVWRRVQPESCTQVWAGHELCSLQLPAGVLKSARTFPALAPVRCAPVAEVEPGSEPK